MTLTTLERLDPANLGRRDLDGVLALFEAVRQVDYPHEIPVTARSFAARIRHGWDGDPPEAFITRDASDRVVGVLEVSLPFRDNTHLGYLDITVDPAARRRGIGRGLHDAGVAQIQAQGRTLVMTESYDSAATKGFGAAVGLEKATESAQRRQDLPALSRGFVDGLAASAAAVAASDYELVRMSAEVPDDVMPALVELLGAINDAPLDDLDLEDEVFSAERFHAFHAAQEAHGRRIYHLVSRHRSTGVLAGHTVVGVESEQPHYAQQFDTSVLAAHRGHRLGLWLKSVMLGWLAEEEPQLRTLDTWNACSNDHMIAVNEALGYQVLATATAYQRHL